MNDNLDDFLSSMGIESTPATSEEAIAEEVQTEITTVQTASSEQMSNDDFAHLLNEVGLTTPQEADAEEVHDVQDVDFEEDDDEENEEESTEGPIHLGEDIMAQVAASYPSEALERINNVIQARLAAEERLHVEESANWQEAVDSGGVVPIENAATSQTSDFDTGVIPDSATDREVHLHMPDGSVVDVPIVEEHTETAVIEESIPQNSPTLSMDNTTSRFSGAEWYDEIQSKSIILAGLGGIGRI